MMMYLFGLWTAGCLGLGYYVGRHAKWEEKNNIAPTFGSDMTFAQQTVPVDEVINDRMKLRPLGED